MSGLFIRNERTMGGDFGGSGREGAARAPKSQRAAEAWEAREAREANNGTRTASCDARPPTQTVSG
ncbi:hypothetical protein C6T52_26115 [Burkholderia multivorans]|nr:hypothetical protein C6T52_26115 [Burkholderia multivorans]